MSQSETVYTSGPKALSGWKQVNTLKFYTRLWESLFPASADKQYSLADLLTFYDHKLTTPQTILIIVIYTTCYILSWH